MKTEMKIKSTASKALLAPMILIALSLTACGKTSGANSSSVADDSSVSGVVAGSVGGALSSTSSAGQMALRLRAPQTDFVAALRGELSFLQKASAQALCPTFSTTDNTCSVSGSEMWLSYNSCSFAGRASWNGVQALTMSAGSASCGAFPNPGANGTLIRQIVSAAGSNTPASLTLADSLTTMTIDDATANLGNFDSQTIAPIANSGYGAAISFNSSGARSSLTIAQHLTVGSSLDHSLSGTLQISESAGAASRTVSGSMTVYHNLMRVVGHVVLTNVVHNNTCCLPVSGQIATSYVAGQNQSPGVAGAKLVGKSESLTFTGCGTATLTAYDGTVSNVSLNRCF